VTIYLRFCPACDLLLHTLLHNVEYKLIVCMLICKCRSLVDAGVNKARGVKDSVDCNRIDLNTLLSLRVISLWSPYVIGQTIIFLPCSFFLSFFFLSFFSSPNLSGRRLDVYHTLAHGVALVRI